MKVLISKDNMRAAIGRALALCTMALALAACTDSPQRASEKLLDASHVDDVRELIGKGADVNYMDANGRTPLRNAVKYNEKGVVTLLLQSGAKANAKGTDGGTALHDAAAEGHVEMAEILIGNGADINVRNKLGNTPLHEAAAFDKFKLVECLLKHNAKADIRNKQGKTAYECAVANHAEHAVKYLASASGTRALANVLSVCGENELIYNLERFRDGKVKPNEFPFLARLCRFRGQGDRKDEYLCADADVIAFFIGAGADVNAPFDANNKAWTPLMLAISNSKWDVVALLLEHHAVCQADSLDPLLRVLLQKGQNAKQAAALLETRKKLAGNVDRYTDGGSMLMDVIMKNDTSEATGLLRLLLEQGANPNVEDTSFVSNADGVPLPLSPIYAAAHKNKADMVALLKSHKADINAPHGGMSDLCRAAICNDAKVCRILLDNGADANAEDSYGETPLFWAVFNNNTEIVAMLVKGGADPKVKSATYGKPLDKIAKSKEVKALLHGK